MRRVIGIILMLLGAFAVAASVILYVGNVKEEEQAGKSSEQLLPKVMEEIFERDEVSADQSEPSADTEVKPESVPTSPHGSGAVYEGNILVAEVDGYKFIGVLRVDKLGLKLPILSETRSSLMRVAPCRFSGSPKGNDLVIGAHNYNTHFGKLDQLTEGDIIVFTDMEGNSWSYSVVLTEILQPNEASELTSGIYPLSLYTCNYNGDARVVVRCENIN